MVYSTARRFSFFRSCFIPGRLNSTTRVSVHTVPELDLIYSTKMSKIPQTATHNISSFSTGLLKKQWPSKTNNSTKFLPAQRGRIILVTCDASLRTPVFTTRDDEICSIKNDEYFRDLQTSTGELKHQSSSVLGV